MKKLLLVITLTAILAGLAEAQQTSDPRVADLVQAGKMRVGIHSFYTKDSRTGELRAVSTGIIFLDIARILGARIGVEVLPVWRVLEDHYGANLVGMVVPEGQTARLTYITDFIEQAKASGLVQQAIERAGLPGHQVAGKTN